MTIRANSPAARDVASLIHPYTDLRTLQDAGPVVMSSGDGVRVIDDQGKEYIDALAGLWCASLGFQQERLVEAAAEAMAKLPFYHTFFGKSHEPGIDLAEKLLELAPVPMSKVFFANSGSEANDTAIKLAWYFNNAHDRPEKKKIISRTKAYHGVTIAAASLTGLPNNHRDFDLPIDRFLHTSCPHHYRYAEPGETEAEFSDRCARDLEDLIEREGADTIAAFIAEPVMGAGGVIPPPEGYFERIQPILKANDILFIVDEVICGFFRTGKRFGAETFGLQPDMMTMAKALSSGYLPISALTISDPIYQAMVEESEKIGMFGHGFTYGGHPVSCAVALETLKIYDEIQISSHVERVAPHFQAALRRIGEHPLIGEARGLGLLGGLEIVRNKETGEPFDASHMVAAFAVRHAEDGGVITRRIGDTLAFSPPLVIDEDHIDRLFGIVEKALDETSAMVEREGLRD